MKGSAPQYFNYICMCIVLLPAVSQSRPNILYILADDLGHGDVGFHNGYGINTPTLDEMAEGGVILEQLYAQPHCSPSRSSLLTGIFPFKNGLQHMQIRTPQPVCMPLSRTLLPQHLKTLGYTTHAIGKWQLGFCNWTCTPTYRGFDTFYGYYSGEEDYYTHESTAYLDLRDNESVVKTENGSYSTHLFTEQAVDIINNHDVEKPMFLYMSYQAPHYPLQVPKAYALKYQHLESEGRRIYAGMVSALDEGVTNITRALKDRGMYENTLIIFSSDNGGDPSHLATNFPLRGAKGTIFEGGTRVAGFVHAPNMIKKQSYRHFGMMHFVDWYPTLIAIAGGKVGTDYVIDGIDQSDMIINGGSSKRTEFVYNLDDVPGVTTAGRAGIRVGDYKLIQGDPGPAGGWYPPPGLNSVLNPDLDSPQRWLFNIRDDPYETTNLYDLLPAVVEDLSKRLQYYRDQMVPAKWGVSDLDALPSNPGDPWSPGWC